jgi:hypothetical protein
MSQPRSNEETALLWIEQIGHHLDGIDRILDQLARLCIDKPAVANLGSIRPMLRHARKELKS